MSLDKEQTELAYRIYVTRILQGLSHVDVDWYSLINKSIQPVDTRSADEIAADILGRLKE